MLSCSILNYLQKLNHHKNYVNYINYKIQFRYIWSVHTFKTALSAVLRCYEPIAEPYQYLKLLFKTVLKYKNYKYRIINTDLCYVDLEKSKSKRKQTTKEIQVRQNLPISKNFENNRFRQKKEFKKRHNNKTISHLN